MKHLVWAVVLLATGANAQMTTLSLEKIEAGTGYRLTAPRFGPDGEAIFFTQTGYRGIWELQLADGVSRRITDDRGAGYGFVLSGNGAQIAYRRTTFEPGSLRRRQEIILQDLGTGVRRSISSGTRVSVPVFGGDVVLFSAGKKTENLQAAVSAGPVLLGIEATRIAVVVNGVKRLLDPLGGGRYIWPALSPDGSRLVAVEMDRGAFVCDLQGNILVRLGRRDAPSWTRDGRWIVYMDDRDDGHVVLSSDLYAVSSDGTTTVQLTDTPDIHEMYPSCSPAGNRIVCSSLDGDLYLLTYGEQ